MIVRHRMVGFMVVTRAFVAEILALAAGVRAMGAAENGLKQAATHARGKPEDEKERDQTAHYAPSLAQLGLGRTCRGIERRDEKGDQPRHNRGIGKIENSSAQSTEADTQEIYHAPVVH